jgi:hypothetical protein
MQRDTQDKQQKQEKKVAEKKLAQPRSRETAR